MADHDPAPRAIAPMNGVVFTQFATPRQLRIAPHGQRSEIDVMSAFTIEFMQAPPRHPRISAHCTPRADFTNFCPVLSKESVPHN